eukprot:11168399-Lingulodinium_polyedra.AAC.1
MPDVPGPLDHFSVETQTLTVVGGQWRMVLRPGDRVRATLGEPARVWLRAAGELAGIGTVRCAWMLVT